MPKTPKLAGASNYFKQKKRHLYFTFYEVFQLSKNFLLLNLELVICHEENTTSWKISESQKMVYWLLTFATGFYGIRSL